MKLNQSIQNTQGAISQALCSVDGNLVEDSNGNDYLLQIVSDGVNPQTTGYQTVVAKVGPVSPGPHTLAVGAYNDYKNAYAKTWVRIDSIVVTATAM